MIAAAGQADAALGAAGPAGAALLATGGAAGAPQEASVGLRPAATIQRPCGATCRTRLQALDAEGRLALLGATDLRLGERVTITIGAGLRFEAVVTEQDANETVVSPRRRQGTRRAVRQVANRTGCRLVLAGGAEAVCDVVDVSATGLFVRTDAPLAVGEVVRIGCTTGRVVRGGADGFGIAIEPGRPKADGAQPTLRAI